MSATTVIRIGTRGSALALFQAKAVQDSLEGCGFATQLVEINSDGDMNIVTPLYELGIQGIFTRTLDSALLEGKIDIAVHSVKDIPTKQAIGLRLTAVLERSTPYDCVVYPKAADPLLPDDGCIIATSSLRRKLQWLDRHPRHRVESLRGNIHTRLRKLDISGWNGAVFAQAALERLNLSTHSYHTLDWMVPAPAQGTIGIVCRDNDYAVIELCRALNHPETENCISAERDFLSRVDGGCAVPIAAHAVFVEDVMTFRVNIMSLDAGHKIDFQLVFDRDRISDAGKLAANEAMRLGAGDILHSFRL